MNRVLITVVYSSLIICGVLALAGGASPTLARQGGGAVTLAWSSLCLIAGSVGLLGNWRQSRVWEVFGALLGASAAIVWTASLILQAIGAKTWGTASAACMGTALAALLAYRAQRIGRGDGA